MISHSVHISDSHETGKIGIWHLKRLWSKSMAKREGHIAQGAFADEWTSDTLLLGTLGLGIEQTLQFLLMQQPTFEEFEDWIISVNHGIVDPERVSRFNATLSGTNQTRSTGFDEDVLTQSDLEFWDEHGYVVVHDAVSQENCRAAEKVIWDFLEMDPSDRSTWYKPHPAKQGIMVQFFQHPALQPNRDSMRIRKAFEQLLGESDLWCNTDRVSFNPPEHEHYTFPGPRLHWDVSLELPIPLGLQGILYLTDTASDQGALTVVPGFQRRIGEWLQGLPEGVNPRMEDIDSLGSMPIQGRAGDFIIWHHALPHGSRPNTNILPRIAQYIQWQTMNPVIQKFWK